MKPLIEGYKHCDRCRGEGIIQYYAFYDNGVCFKCKGKGIVKIKVKKIKKDDSASIDIDELPY